MENSDYNDKLKQLEEYKKNDEENLRKEIELKILYEKQKEKQREERKAQKRLAKEIEKEQREKEKLRETNEKLNKKRLDNDEVYTWGELIMRENSFVTIEETEEIWVYLKELGCYAPNGKMYLLKLCANGGARTNDNIVFRQLIMLIKGKSSKKLSDFIHPEHLMNLKNGVIDMNNNILLPKSSEYNFQNVLPITYNKDATCHLWKEFIRGMFETDEDYIRTQKWFGYHLLRENKEQIMHGFVGESGCGKGTMLHILTELLGKENVTHFNIQDFSVRVNSYALGMLYEKLANITFDMSSAPIKYGTFEIIKNLTSGDRINARNIREAPFVFVPRAKLTFACNKLPYVTDDMLNSEEFKRRMMITKVVKKENFVKDTELRNKLKDELYSGGIFNWILEGRRKYLEDQSFNYDHDNIPFTWNHHMDLNYKLYDSDKIDKSQNVNDEEKTAITTVEELDRWFRR
mgnify:CR=1 FL=1